MKIVKAYTGKWVPRTTLHLEEYYKFLSRSESDLSLNSDQLNKLRNELNVKDVKWDEGIWSKLTAKFGRIEFKYLKDGVITLGIKIQSPEEDINHLKEFYGHKLKNSFSYIYSKGAPVPQIFGDEKSKDPLILYAKEITKSEIDLLYLNHQDSLAFQIETEQGTIYGGRNLFIFPHELANKNFVNYLIFIHSYNVQLHKFLNLHRIYWDEISLIRKKQSVRYKDLPVMRDELINLQKDISFFNSRIVQMRHLAELRLKNVESDFEKEYLEVKKIFNKKLSTLLATQEYMEELWKMTGNYCDKTIDMIKMLYQENEQKEISTLQVIFLVGVITSIISLGTLSGANITLLDKAGEKVLTGSIASWEFLALLKFGLTAFTTAILVYLTIHFIFTRLVQFRVVDISKIREKTIESIKKGWQTITPF